MSYKIFLLFFCALILAWFPSEGQIREIIQSVNQKIDSNGVYQKKRHHFFAGVGLFAEAGYGFTLIKAEMVIANHFINKN